MGKKDKKPSSGPYTWEYVIPGIIPSTRINDHGSGSERSERVNAYKSHLAEEARRLLIENGVEHDYPLGRSERVLVTVIQFAGNASFIEKCDVDNFGKTVLDGLKGVIYENDADVHVFLTTKILVEGYPDIAYIGVKRIPSSTDFHELVKNAGLVRARTLCDKVNSLRIQA